MDERSSASLIQNRWFRYQSRRFTTAKVALRDRCRCCVCHDECVHLVLCPNNHALCVGCDALTESQNCPLCREVRSDRMDSLLPSVTSSMRLMMHCPQCDVHLSSDRIEFHRAWCPMFAFECPIAGCTRSVCAKDLCEHVRTHHHPIGGSRITFAISRFSSTIVCIVEGIVVVLTCTPEHAHSSDIFSSTMSLHLRAYYPGPNAMPLLATVTQKRVVDVRADTFLERFHVGVVPPVLASRERLVHCPYAPRLTPRCLMTSFTPGTIDRPLWMPNPAQDVQTYGIRDIPTQMRSHRARDHSGIPMALVTLTFTLDHNAFICRTHPC